MEHGKRKGNLDKGLVEFMFRFCVESVSVKFYYVEYFNTCSIRYNKPCSWIVVNLKRLDLDYKFNKATLS